MRGGIQSNDGIPTLENESLNGRMVPQYAGITTTLASGIANAVTNNVSLTGVANLGLKIGDYLAIDDEIVKLKLLLLIQRLTQLKYSVLFLEQGQWHTIPDQLFVESNRFWLN